MAGQKPVAKLRAGAVSAAVWAHEANVGGQATTLLKVSIERRYRDASGTWKSSTSFSRNEIPCAAFVLAKAFEYMVEERNVRGEEEAVV